MSDVYTFEDDLDRTNEGLPADQRAGLTVHHDGEHLVFGLRERGDNREIYLTPEQAGDAGRLLLKLADADADADDKPAMSCGRAGALVVIWGLLVYWTLRNLWALGVNVVHWIR